MVAHTCDRCNIADLDGVELEVAIGRVGSGSGSGRISLTF
jgi:hypothetical protein